MTAGGVPPRALAIAQDPLRRQPAGAAQHAGTRMASGPAEVEARDRRGVSAPSSDRTHEEDLIQPQLAVRGGTLAKPEALLEVARGPGDLMEDPRGEARRDRLDGGGHGLRQRVPSGAIPDRAVTQLVGRVLRARHQDVLAPGSEVR